MRFLFVVQGEGRGHLTQAISMREILVRQGHEICAVLVGHSRSRRIPDFFAQRIQTPVEEYITFNFRLDPNRKGADWVGTFLENLWESPRFVKSIGRISRTIQKHQPDVIVNFFEPLFALWSWVRRPKAPIASVAHQYLIFHPDFERPRGRRLAVLGMILFSRLTSLGSRRKLALSFRPMEDVPREKLVVAPPLLRSQVREMEPETEDFLLAYFVNEGYAYDLAEAQKRHSDLKILAFWDKKDAPTEMVLQPNMIVHRLDDVAFLDAMRRCRALITTAGFESICEAMLLGKPVFMRPVDGQIEQHCNAIDAARSGAGIRGFDFDLDRFRMYIPQHQQNRPAFQEWVCSGQTKFPEVLEELTQSRTETTNTAKTAPVKECSAMKEPKNE